MRCQRAHPPPMAARAGGHPRRLLPDRRRMGQWQRPRRPAGAFPCAHAPRVKPRMSGGRATRVSSVRVRQPTCGGSMERVQEPTAIVPPTAIVSPRQRLVPGCCPSLLPSHPATYASLHPPPPSACPPPLEKMPATPRTKCEKQQRRPWRRARAPGWTWQTPQQQPGPQTG